MDSSTGRLLALLLYCLALMGQTSVGDPIPEDKTVNQDLKLLKFTLTGQSLEICSEQPLVDSQNNLESLKSCRLIYKPDGGTTETNLNTNNVQDTCAIFEITAPLPTSLMTYDMVVEVDFQGGEPIRRTGTTAFTPQTYKAVKISCGGTPLYRVAGPGAIDASDSITNCINEPALASTYICYSKTEPVAPFCYTPTGATPTDFKMCIDELNQSDDITGSVDDQFGIVSLNYPTESTGARATFTAKFADPAEMVEVIVQNRAGVVNVYQCPKGGGLARDEHDCIIPVYAPKDDEYQVCGVAFTDAGALEPSKQGSNTFADLNAFSYEQETQFVVGFVNSNPGVEVGGAQVKKYVVSTDSTDPDTITIDCSSIEIEMNCYGFFTGIDPGTERAVTVAFDGGSNAISFSYKAPPPNE